jgi:hypothetical protein
MAYVLPTTLREIAVVSGVPAPARDRGEPQPFTHLSVPNAGLYRSLLLTFAQAKERFIASAAGGHRGRAPDRRR